MKDDSGLLEAIPEQSAVEAANHDPAERLIAMLDPAVLGSVMVELSAVLGRGELSMQQLASLTPGEVVSLDTPLNGLADLRLNDCLIARGEIVAVEDRFGLRITEILTMRK